MSLRLLSRPVAITRRAPDGVDSEGRPIVEDESVETLGAAWQTRTASTFDGGLVLTDEVTIALPPDATILPGDFVSFADEDGEYEVVSDPFGVYNQRTKQVHHLELRARKAAR
jgi:hypothetical protein